MIIPYFVEKIIDRFEKNGFEIFLVGGCVRDYLLGRKINDYDMTTNATPDQMHKILQDFHVIDTGIKHGTITVISDGNPIEITTYRKDECYSDSRHPDSVCFVSDLNTDLARRDLTINAMAYNKRCGFVDIFGGREDLQNRVIRFVGNANERVKEDALRILRALRYSAISDFKIDAESLAAMERNKILLNNVSKERIGSEIAKLLCCERAHDVIFNHINIFEYILPEIYLMKDYDQNNHHHKYDLLKHSCLVVKNIPSDLVLRLSAIFHDCGKPCVAHKDTIKNVTHYKGHQIKSAEIARNVLKRLRFDSRTIKDVCELIYYHDFSIEPEKSSAKKMMSLIGLDQFKKLLWLQSADNCSKSPIPNKRFENAGLLFKIVDEIVENNECFSYDMLAINGNDIKKHFSLNGRSIGELLGIALNAVIYEKCSNNKEDIIAYLSTRF